MHFGMTMAEVGGLSLSEFGDFADIYKDKTKLEAELMSKVMLNALVNVELIKGKKDTVDLFEDEKEVKSREELLEERRELFGE